MTLVTYQRVPLFNEPENVARLRRIFRQVKREQPFEFHAAVVLPDHGHFLWSLPRGDTSYSRRVGVAKVLFTRALRGEGALPRAVSPSRLKQRESDVWQRRFWEHTIEDEGDFERHLNYIHYNPVKHGLAACPHLWPHSSFPWWVRNGTYHERWGCCCGGASPRLTEITHLDFESGE